MSLPSGESFHRSSDPWALGVRTVHNPLESAPKSDWTVVRFIRRPFLWMYASISNLQWMIHGGLKDMLSLVLWNFLESLFSCHFFKNWTPQFMEPGWYQMTTPLRFYKFCKVACWMGHLPTWRTISMFCICSYCFFELIWLVFCMDKFCLFIVSPWDIYIYIPYLPCVCFAWSHLTQLLQRFASLYQDHSAVVTMRWPGQPADCWWETPHHSLATSCGSAMFSHRRKILWKHSVTIWAVLRFPDLD